MNPSLARACAYCGLPVPAWWHSTEAEPAYCCYGCRFAASVTGSDGHGGAAARWMFARLGLAIFFTMNVMVFTMALWSADVYGSVDAPLAGLFRYLCLFFAAPVLWWLGVPLLENTWASLRHGIVNTDLLLVAGVVASYVYSSISVLRDGGPVYFEVGCFVLLLVTLGRWLEATGRSRATGALNALEKLLPERVHLLDRYADKPLAEVVVGDRLHVRAGERVPCDGIVLNQAAWIDEQLLTGENAPRFRELGASVYAGTLNLDGDLFLEVTRGPDAGALARIIRMVQQAHASKGRHELLADRLTAWFLPAVAVIAVATTVYHSTQHGLDHGLMAGMAVVLIACPCALGIATPLAVWMTTGAAARRQVLFKSGAALEQLAALRHLFFDKTGTLTLGSACNAAWVPADNHDGPRALERARALASASTHPLSRTILAQGRDVPRQCDHVRTLPGRGLRGEWPASGETLYLGSTRLMKEEKLAMPEALAPQARAALVAGQPLVCIGWTDSVRGLFIFSEQFRSEASTTMALLRGLGIGITVLTGDSAYGAQLAAKELRVEALAELLPEQKVALVAARHRGPVGMVGDGINDAPGLAAADVGIAMGCGADVARDCADLCLLSNDLTRLPWAIRLARRTVRIIRQNLFWAFAYNVVGIALAAADLLNPVLAAAAMALSSALVLANSLRLRDPAETPTVWSNPSSSSPVAC
jgi:heavy metal translocating P-type ATPase